MTLEEAITIAENNIKGYFLDYYAYNFPEMYVFSIMNNDYKEKPMDSVHLCGVYKNDGKFINDPKIVMDCIMSHQDKLNEFKTSYSVKELRSNTKTS